MADTLDLACSDPEATIRVYNSIFPFNDSVAGNGSVLKSAVTVYLPEVDSFGYYRLTDGRGFISSKNLKEKGLNIASVPCPELRLQSLVRHCEQRLRTHIPYHPVRFDLPGPGPMVLKVDLPYVRPSANQNS